MPPAPSPAQGAVAGACRGKGPAALPRRRAPLLISSRAAAGARGPEGPRGPAEGAPPARGRRATAAGLGAALGAALGAGAPRAPRARAAGARRRRALVTGANSGIGLAAATELARRGWEVVPACRTPEKAAGAARDIEEQVPGAAVRCLEARCELADLRSVGGFGRAVRELGGPVDALVLNAGVDGAPLQRTAQGQEWHFGVNHLGHFALYRAVRGLLPQEDSRVISVTSSAALDAELVLDDLAWERREYGRHAAYSTSKACNVLFVDELARREGVRAYAVDPGPTASAIVRYSYPQRAAQRRQMTPEALARQARMLRLKTPAQAAEGLVWLAEAPEAMGLSGQWFAGPGALFPPLDTPWRTEANAKQLWERCEGLVAAAAV